MSEPGELSRGLAKDLEYLHDCEDALIAMRYMVYMLEFKVLILNDKEMTEGAIEMHTASLNTAKEAIEKMNRKWWNPAHE